MFSSDIILASATFWALYGVWQNRKLKKKLAATKSLLAETDSIRGAWKLFAHQIASRLPQGDEVLKVQFEKIGAQDADIRLRLAAGLNDLHGVAPGDDC